MLTALLLLQLTAAPTDAAAPQLLIQDLNTNTPSEAADAQAIGEALSQEVQRRGFFKPLSASDVRTILGVERQKQMVGCGEASTCLTELAGALGAPYVLSGSLSRIGSSLQLTLQMLDVQKSQPVARSVRIAKDVETLIAMLPFAVAEATGTPPPPARSKAPSYAMIAGGSALVIGGAVLGVITLSGETSLQNELRIGTTNSGVLQNQQYYKSQASQYSLQRDVSLAAVAVGAALVGAGIYFMPSGEGGVQSVALVPTGSGVALAGVLR